MRADKLEYENKLNQLLGTNIRWRKLSGRELHELASVLADTQRLAEKLGLNKPLTPQEKIATGVTGVVELIQERPILKLLSQLPEKKVEDKRE
ncbi:MAG: hypothetical protein QW356_04620 [Candidatus Hadarchaeales archaeon]